MSILTGCTHRPIDQSVRGWDHMMGYSGYGGMIMWLTILIIGGGIVYFAFVQGKKKGGNPKNEIDERPMEILRKRYAKGEITKEEFEEVKNDLRD